MLLILNKNSKIIFFSCDVGILLNCIDEDILILNAVDEYSFSLLHFAVESSDIKVVHALLEK